MRTTHIGPGVDSGGSARSRSLNLPREAAPGVAPRDADAGEADAPTARGWPVDTVQVRASAAIAQSQSRLDQLTGSIAALTNNLTPAGQVKQVAGATRQFQYTVQGGSIVLSGHAGNIDLGGPGDGNGADSIFSIRVSGVRGGPELSFVSGTSLADIADSINAYTPITGVEAEWSKDDPNHVRLHAAGGDPNAFVSLRVLEDGDANVGISTHTP